MINVNFNMKAKIEGDKVVVDSNVRKEMSKGDFLRHYAVQSGELSNIQDSIKAFKQKLEYDEKKIKFPEKIKKFIEENKNEIMAYVDIEATKEGIKQFEKMEYNTLKELAAIKPVYLELKKELDKKTK